MPGSCCRDEKGCDRYRCSAGHFRSAFFNPDLSKLIGAESIEKGTSDIVIECHDKAQWTLYKNVAAVVDFLMEDQKAIVERRWIEEGRLMGQLDEI